MPLKNYQYNRILREYDSRQQQNKRELRLRMENAHRVIPELEDLDQRIRSAALSFARFQPGENESSPSLLSLQQETHLLSRQKQTLLAQYGFPEDYLKLGYHCADCQDTGYIGLQKCHCFKQAIVDLLYHQSNIRETLERENFTSFSFQYYSDEYTDPSVKMTPLANAHRVVSACRSFIARFDETAPNLLLYGNTGVGKTFLANCIAKELLDTSHTVIYLTSFQLFDILEKYTFQHKEEDNDAEASFDYILDCDLLILDDLGTELYNSFTNSRLYLCINERQLRHKSTLISTNLSLDDINKNYSERIFSRLTSDYMLQKLVGEDIRIKKVFV